MSVGIIEFIEHVYHFITEVVLSDSILKVTSKKGNVIIISEERYNTMMEIVEEYMKN